jgi:hypothetical protein
MKRLMTLLAWATAIGAAGRAAASDPVGVYGVIEYVKFEPNEVEPERVQLWGWFEMANKEERRYSEPRRGCLYYRLDNETKAICRKEWRDLDETAGSGKCVAFGQRYAELGKVREKIDESTVAVPYPVASGLFEIREDSDYGPIRALADIPLVLSPGDGSLAPRGEITMKVRNVRGKAHAGAKYRFELAERGGDALEKSEPIAAGETQTSWSPKTKLEAGKRYVWRVRAHDGDWKSSPVESLIVVKGASTAS